MPFTSIDTFANPNDAEAKEIPRSHISPESSIFHIQPSTVELYTELEIVLASVWSWSRKHLETSSLISDPMPTYLTNLHQPPLQDSRTMHRTFELVFDLWHNGRGDLAGMAARRGFYLLEYVLSDDHPHLIWHILDTLYDLIFEGHIKLFILFLEHTINLCHRKVPKKHPLLRILLQIRRYDPQTYQGRLFMRHLLQQAWLRNVEILCDRITSSAPQHLWLYEQLIWDGKTSLRSNSNLAQRQQSLLYALEKLSQSRHCSKEHLWLVEKRVSAIVLDFTYKDIGDHRTAERLALQLLDHTAGSTLEMRLNARFNAYARKVLAWIYGSHFHMHMTERNLKWAIGQREIAHGTPNDPRVVREMWLLAWHYQKSGRQEAAEKIKHDAIDRANQYLTDLPGL